MTQISITDSLLFQNSKNRYNNSGNQKGDTSMGFVYFLLSLLGSIALVVLGFYLLSLYQRRYYTLMTSEQFREGYRKSQLIDVREPDEFRGGHILGARNIPISQFSMRMKEIRKDQPIYLYCQTNFRSIRGAQQLYRKGYRNIFLLKGGYKNWDGKIKK
jgi:rhodanese-related sulfurtransferase